MPQMPQTYLFFLARFATVLQPIDTENLLMGASPLLKIQVTYCGDFQTLLGITAACVVTGKLTRCPLVNFWTCSEVTKLI